MGRKNTRAYGKGQVSKRYRELTIPLPPPPRRPFEQRFVPTSGSCGAGRTRKLRYADERTALRALKLVQSERERKGQSIVEKRVYEHKASEGGCGGWHLTSMGAR